MHDAETVSEESVAGNVGMKCSYSQWGKWGVRRRVSEDGVGPELKAGDVVVSGENLLNPFPWALSLPPLWTQASS